MLTKSLLSCATIIVGTYFLYASCVRHATSAHPAPARFTIVCTTTIIADAVRTIVGDHAIVHTLMGPNIDPHIYRARESDVHKLASADLIIYHGLHLEGRMAHILDSTHHYSTCVAVTSIVQPHELKLLDPATGTYDPHVWLNVSLWIRVVAYIGTILCQADPDHAQEYRDATEQYCAHLDKLHHFLLAKAAQLSPEKRILVTAHDAFGYFGDAYGFTVVGLQGISTQAEPSIADVHRVATFLVNNHVPALFVESLIPERTLKAVQHACAAQQWQVTLGPELYTDALSNLHGPASTYDALMRHNMESIVHALS